jgi:HEAT repeat protein
MIVVALSLLLSLSAPDQPSKRPALEFKDAPTADKKATLNALALDRVRFDANELRELLEYGLSDDDSEVRRQSLMAVAGRSARLWYGMTPTTGGDQERLALKLLRPRLVALLDEEDEQLRLAALLALGNLELERTSQELILGPDVSQMFAGLYARDPSPRIRQEILKTFALLKTTGDPKPVATAVLNGLTVSDVTTVQYALMAVAKLQLAQALPAVAGHLKGSDRRIRMAAAQGLAAFGVVSRPYLPQLQQASQVEQDDITKRTMLGAIAALTPPQ